jgi:hypothetical protein
VDRKLSGWATLVKRSNWWQTMVDVTILIEGDNSLLNKEAETMGGISSLRAAFNALLSKEIDTTEFNLSVDTFGSIYNTPNILNRTRRINPQPFFLIDLDGTKDEKHIRLQDNYETEDWPRIFFMIQRMEAWILSQPDIIEHFGTQIQGRQKSGMKPIAENPLIKNKHPEKINNPDVVLATIFRQHFKVSKRTGDKPKPKTYSKSKDAPELIKLLDSKELRATFDEFDNLLLKINEIHDPQ